MSKKKDVGKSVRKLIRNESSKRKISAQDGLWSYVSVAVLQRIQRSRHRKDFVLKGGHLVAARLEAPKMTTRDLDLLFSPGGEPDPERMKEIMWTVLKVGQDDGVTYTGITGKRQERARGDAYDGVELKVAFAIHRSRDHLKIDVGFGDALVPPPESVVVRPFLEQQGPARVLGYRASNQIAEKVQALLSGLDAHRLKDIPHVLELEPFADDKELVASFRSTFDRRRFEVTTARDALEKLAGLPGHREWDTTWSTMLKERGVDSTTYDFREQVSRFSAFVGSVLDQMG